MAQASFARNDVPYAGAGTLLHTTLNIFSSSSASSLQWHFHCQKYYIIDNYNSVFIKFTCWLSLFQFWKTLISWHSKSNKTNLEAVVVCTCIRLLHLQNGSNYVFPIRHGDMPRCSVHHRHIQHHLAKSDLALRRSRTNHSSVCSRLPRNSQACGKWRSLHRFPSSHHISFPTCHLRTTPLFLDLK